MQRNDSQNDAPAVSVLMSVYNAERYVREATESILGQTFTDFEFIVFDDGSTDRSPQILREYAGRDPRVRLTVRPNQGLTRTLNEGLALARGQFVARMDCDDVALPHRLATQVEFLRRHEDVVCAGGYWELMDGAGRMLTTIRPPTDDAAMQELLLKGHSPLCHPLAVFRREPAVRLGGYGEEFTTAQDVDLWLRLGEVGRLANVPQVLLKFRLHESSVSETKRHEQRRLSRLACERAWRRRGIQGKFEADEPWRPGKDRASRHRYALLYGWWAFNSGQRRTAALYGWKAVHALPFSRAGWALLASAAIKGTPRPQPQPAAPAQEQP